MSDQSHPNSPEQRRGPLHIVTSSEISEEHEVHSSLVFFDLADKSMSNGDITSALDAIIAEDLTPEKFRHYPTVEYPRIIARNVLEAVHVIPNLTELQQEIGDTPEKDLEPELQAELQRALQIEDLFDRSRKLLEQKIESNQTNNFVDELEEYIDTNDYYESNVLRACMLLHRRRDFVRYNTPNIVSTRLIKTMLYINDQDARQS